MTQLVLSDLAIRINNVNVGYKSNSLKFKLGTGEKSVKGVSTGPGGSDIAISENIETKVGMIQFELFSTSENEDLFKQWRARPDLIGNSIKIFDNSFTGTMARGVIVNDPDFNVGTDESVEIQFEGSPIQ